MSLLRRTLLCALTALIITCAAAGAAPAQAAGKKILVAYFSHSGNTRAVANRIAERTGGELFEIKPLNAYPTGLNECYDRARKERDENARPALSSKLENAGSYDVIFLGFPNWWGSIPMPVFTFLEAHGFSGKTIIPFCTHEGSGFGRSIQDIAKLCPRSTLAEGLAFRGSSASNARAEIDTWLQKNGFAR